MEAPRTSPPALGVADAFRRHWRFYLMEAAGLIAFMLGAGAFTTLFLYPGSSVQQALPTDLLRNAGIGACMGVVTYAIIAMTGGRSGAHINPAVTWTYYRLGKIGGWDACFYTLFQFAGALAAPALLYAAIGEPFTHDKVKYATSQPGPQGAAAAFAAEFAISFVLMLVLLIAANSSRLSKFLPLLAAVLIAAYIAIESPLSGMSMNPARTFGSAVTAGQWSGLWIYFTAPVAAMLLAAEAYRLMVAKRMRLVTAHHDPAPAHPVEQP